MGAECAAVDRPFFLEPLVYDDNVGEEKTIEFARVKPKYVTATSRSSPRRAMGWTCSRSKCR